MKTKTIKEPNKQEFTFERTFDAPRDIVFQVYNDPKRMPDWWGPAGYKFLKLDMDVRTGGSWEVIQTDESGLPFGFRGVYHEVKKPERVVWTFEFDGTPGHVSLETVIFEELDDKTKIIGKSVYQSTQDRDAMIESGMEEGLNEGLDRFEELLKSLKK
jgi:uncharacterized protein YndB with AHSA1/START domain